MKRIIKLCAAILIYGIVTAQVCDDIQNNTTDPVNPSDYRGNNEGYDPTPPNPPDPNYTPLLINPFYNKLPDGSGPKFNWATPNLFEWYLPPGTSIPTVMIESPFNPANHWDNAEHLKNNDYMREEYTYIRMEPSRPDRIIIKWRVTDTKQDMLFTGKRIN
jgi:hypothetical protein